MNSFRFALLLPSHSPKRAETEPCKGQREANGEDQTSGTGRMSRLILAVLAHASQRSNGSQRQERESRHLKPELVEHSGEGAEGGPEPLDHGRARPAATRLLGRYAQNQAHFPGGGVRNHRMILAVAERTITVAGITKGCDVGMAGRFEGGSVDQQLKQLMKELGEAINGSLSESEQIAEVVARIKEGGYDIFLVLEATIGVIKQGENVTDETMVSALSTNPELKVSDQDLKFLKSLRIKIDAEEEEESKHKDYRPGS